MHEHLDHDPSEYHNKESSDTQEEIYANFDEDQDSERILDFMTKLNLKLFRDLARQYYQIGKIMKMEEYQDHGYKEILYTLIEYENQDELVEIGRGQFHPEIFLRRDIQEYAGFTHSPLKLFVTDSWARNEDKSSPEEFLQRHAILYSPKGGQVEIRKKHSMQPFNHGDSIGIVTYDDAMLALQNAEVKKMFPNGSFEDFANKMKELKGSTFEELEKRVNLNPEDIHYDPAKELYKKMFPCLRKMSKENVKNLQKLIKSFEHRERAFIKKSKKKK